MSWKNAFSACLGIMNNALHYLARTFLWHASFALVIANCPVQITLVQDNTYFGKQIIKETPQNRIIR